MKVQPFAAIDMGSNATRMAIGILEEGTGLRIINTNRYPLRLGTGVFCNGNITSELIDEAVDIFSNMRKIFIAKGVGRVRAVATSALREAKNSQTLVERIQKSSGIKLEVISGLEEASLVSWAICDKLGVSDDLATIADLGAGSLEMIKVKSGKPVWMNSYTIGSVKYAGMDANVLEMIIPESLDADITDLPKDLYQSKTLIATGGNIEVISALIEHKTEENGTRSITIDNLLQFIKQCKKMTIEEIRYYFNLLQERAEVIVPAAIINVWLARKLGQNSITVPLIGLREAVLMDLALSFSEL